ncbi:PIG-L family deacetylase [Paraburkholderia sediminicola]|uniref:PIG-L family deacetylase n=1 Tax=Paraburkholderia sediminicola TaxID=458836 RepID=UPI0038BA341B
MRYTSIALIVGTALCRDVLASTPIAPVCTYKVQAIVAHQDDDLFFMQTDLQRHLERGACAEVVYLTNGKLASDTWDYSARRDIGALTAWSSMAGAPAPESIKWSQDRPDVIGYKPVRYTHPDGRLTHIHLGIDDAWEGSGWGSHTPLSRAYSDTSYAAPAYPAGPAAPGAAESNVERYRVKGPRNLVHALAQLIFKYQPDILYLQDPSITTAVEKLCWLCGENNDHPDRAVGAKLALRGMSYLYMSHATQFYVGDPGAARAANLTSAESDMKTRVAAWYGKYDSKYQCSSASASAPPSCSWPPEAEGKWLKAQYILARGAEPLSRQIAPIGAADSKGGAIVAYVGSVDNKLHVRSTVARRLAPVEGRFAGVPAVAVGRDARLAVFARTAQNDLVHVATNSDGGWLPAVTWRDSVIVSSPQAIANSDGRLAVVARAVDKSVLYRAEAGVGGAWGSWLPTGLKGAGDPAVVKDATGALAVAVRDGMFHGPLRIRSQVLPGQAAFSDVEFPETWSLVDPIMLNGADGGVIVVTKEMLGVHNPMDPTGPVGDFKIYRQSSPVALSASPKWTQVGLGIKENWINVTATMAQDKVIVAGSCGAGKAFAYVNPYEQSFPNLCVWKDGVITDLGPVDGVAKFVSDDGADPMLVVRSERDASVLASKFKDGAWSAFSAL